MAGCSLYDTWCALYCRWMGGATVMRDEPDAPPKIVRQCLLDKQTQELVRIIFDNDMFNNAMQKLELGKCKIIVMLSTGVK